MKSNPSPDMVAVVPTHRRNRLLQRTLRSIMDAQIPRSLREIRVVENGGRHGAEQITSAFRGLSNVDVRYFYLAQGNKSAALNRVLEDLDNELVVFFDDDVRVHPGNLVAYEQAASDAHGAVFFGGPFSCDYETPPPDWLTGFLPISARGWASEDGSVMHPRTPFIGFNWAAFAGAMKAVGGFDANVGPGGVSGGTGQESAMQMALTGSGARPLYVEGAMVWHYVPRTQCSPGWSLRRAFRAGITQGLHDEVREGSRQFAGVPLWVLRSCLTKGVGVPLAMLAKDPAARHLPKYQFCLELGRIVGIRRKDG